MFTILKVLYYLFNKPIMKKILAFLLVISVTNSFSQLSVSFDNKYGFKMLGSYAQLGFLASSSSYYYGYGNQTSTGGVTTLKSKKYDFGNGYQGGISARYGFKSGLGIDLGLGYLLGTASKTTDHEENNNYPYYNNTYDGNDKYKARIFRINLGASHIGSGKLAPVIKMGVTMAMGKIVYSSGSTQVQTSTQYSYNPNPPYNTYTLTNTTNTTNESSGKFYGGISLGFYSALGVNYKLNDNVSLMLCLDVVVQNFSPKKYILQKSKANGVDQLPTMMKSDKEVEFAKSVTETNTPPNNLSPSQYPKLSLPLSSFGPSFSIRYTIGKKEAAKTSEPKQE
jgi:hypothetical protein